jgi:hypothetical protein
MHICNGARRGVYVHMGLITEAMTLSNRGVTHPTTKLRIEQTGRIQESSATLG